MLFQQPVWDYDKTLRIVPREIFSFRPEKSSKNFLTDSPQHPVLNSSWQSMQFRTPFPDTLALRAVTQLPGRRREVAVDISISKFHVGMIVPTLSLTNTFPATRSVIQRTLVGEVEKWVGPLDTQLCG